MPGSTSLFDMHALLKSDYAILKFFCTLLLCAEAQRRGAWHNTPPINTRLDVHVLMVTAYLLQLETIQQVFSKGVVC